MNDQINTWLKSNKDYKEGLALFEAFGNNPVMLKQFSNGRPINMKMYLEVELKKLLKNPNRYEKKRQKESRYVISSQGFTRTKPSGKKLTELEEVEKYRKDQFVKMAQLRNSIVDIKTDEKRAEAIKQVEVLETKLKALWEAIDYYNEHGKWENGNPVGNPIADINESKPKKTSAKKATIDAELLKAKADWANLRKRITRAEKALEKLKATEGEQSAKTIKKEKALFEMYAEKDQLLKIIEK